VTAVTAWVIAVTASVTAVTAWVFALITWVAAVTVWITADHARHTVTKWNGDASAWPHYSRQQASVFPVRHHWLQSQVPCFLPVKPLALPVIAAHSLSPVAVGLRLPSHTPLAPVTGAFPLPVKPLDLPIIAAHSPIPCGSRPLSSQSDATGSSHRCLSPCMSSLWLCLSLLPIPYSVWH